jgi:uncharacterized membrane protein
MLELSQENPLSLTVVAAQKAEKRVPGRFPGSDLLRGLCIVAVVLHHINLTIHFSPFQLVRRQLSAARKVARILPIVFRSILSAKAATYVAVSGFIQRNHSQQLDPLVK